MILKTRSFYGYYWMMIDEHIMYGYYAVIIQYNDIAPVKYWPLCVFDVWESLSVCVG